MKVFITIVLVALLGVIFVPSPYANSYGVPESQLKRGMPIELILKNRHYVPVIRNSKIVTGGKSLDIKVLEDTHTISNNHGKVYKQFYDKNLDKYIILGLKK